jgi:hypothetical protein
LKPCAVPRATRLFNGFELKLKARFAARRSKSGKTFFTLLPPGPLRATLRAGALSEAGSIHQLPKNKVMSEIASISNIQVQPLAVAATTQPSLMSQLAQAVSVNAGLEASAAETLDKVSSARNVDGATLLRLQTQSAALSISTAAVSQLASTLGNDLLKITGDL